MQTEPQTCLCSCSLCPDGNPARSLRATVPNQERWCRTGRIPRLGAALGTEITAIQARLNTKLQFPWGAVWPRLSRGTRALGHRGAQRAAANRSSPFLVPRADPGAPAGSEPRVSKTGSALALIHRDHCFYYWKWGRSSSTPLQGTGALGALQWQPNVLFGLMDSNTENYASWNEQDESFIWPAGLFWAHYLFLLRIHCFFQVVFMSEIFYPIIFLTYSQSMSWVFSLFELFR